MICARCHRALVRDPIYLSGSAYGPRCATAITGSKPRRGRITTALRAADGRQHELFAEETS
ncbi:hypothetical protein J2W35_003273 [Variovorax boronicumulans]|uniref:hypothetical protein n=1 Tax=Variovorax boronicumulans TaxID=436515 RepID=UPI00278A7BAF|nr:hypothetical protein [Variovorax boronicumulans]MDQ0082914.1 hypothetical protein [Variovorax boronicumulans]